MAIVINPSSFFAYSPGTVRYDCATCDTTIHSGGGLGLDDLQRRAGECRRSGHQVSVSTLA